MGNDKILNPGEFLGVHEAPVMMPQKGTKGTNETKSSRSVFGKFRLCFLWLELAVEDVGELVEIDVAAGNDADNLTGTCVY